MTGFFHLAYFQISTMDSTYQYFVPFNSCYKLHYYEHLCTSVVWVYVFNSLGYTPRDGILTVALTTWRTLGLFFRVAAPFHIPTSNGWGEQLQKVGCQQRLRVSHLGSALSARGGCGNLTATSMLARHSKYMVPLHPQPPEPIYRWVNWGIEKSNF